MWVSPRRCCLHVGLAAARLKPWADPPFLPLRAGAPRRGPPGRACSTWGAKSSPAAAAPARPPRPPPSPPAGRRRARGGWRRRRGAAEVTTARAAAAARGTPGPGSAPASRRHQRPSRRALRRSGSGALGAMAPAGWEVVGAAGEACCHLTGAPACTVHPCLASLGTPCADGPLPCCPPARCRESFKEFKSLFSHGSGSSSGGHRDRPSGGAAS